MGGYSGLSYQQKDRLQQCYGPGAMIINKPTILQLFFQQVFRPMFLFVIYSIIVWLNMNYAMYASVIAFSMIISLIINLIQTYQLNNKIHQMAYYQTQLNVLRQNKILTISSLEIVPGDVVFFDNKMLEKEKRMKIPFDGKVLEGSMLINQCSLTGESVPIVKKACKDMGSLDDDKGCAVFEGTTIVQVNSKIKFKYFQRYRQTFGVPVCVTKTNFYTSKGSLIRIIRFPKQLQNIFQKQSSKFLIFIFFFTLITYGIIAIKLWDIVGIKGIILKIMDLITVTIPPGLPVSMTLGIIYAVEKLKKKNIYCTSQNNIIKGGRVNHVCFDKTGTLTENFMDFYGFIPYYQGSFKSLIKNQYQINDQIIQKNPHMKRILYNFGSNHTLIQNLCTKQIIGDPMQGKLFQFGNFQFNYQNSHNPDIIFSFRNIHNINGDVLKVFQFDSDVQRMSVVSKNRQQQFYTLCKGSPEILKSLLNQRSFNMKEYDHILKNYSSQGYRILAIASKKIVYNNNININMMKRNQIQSQLNFDGFVIFQNKLKPESHQTILQLKQADINCAMITGDNPLTACCMALECQIADVQKNIFIIELDKNVLKVEEFNSKNQKMQYKLTSTYNQQAEKIIFKLIENNLYCQLCFTGNAFAYLFERGESQSYSTNLIKIFQKATVFARVKPNQKAKIVSIYQSTGKIVGMCGDGANDCGALKQAQIGLSLSQTQSSISSPFTSKIFNISPMVQLIKQCRAALATNFSLFNIMSMYSLIQYTTALICQYFYSYPNDIKYFYWDIFGNFLLLLTYGYIGTNKKLTKQIPSNSLFSLSNIFQLLSMFSIQFIGQVICVYMTMEMFTEKIGYYDKGGVENNKEYYKKNGDFIRDSSQCNVLFLFSNLLYISSFIAFSIQKPWRKRFYTCIPFLIIFFIVTIYSSLLILVPGIRLSIFNLDQLKYSQFNLSIFCLSGIFCWFIYSNQKLFLQPISNMIRLKNKGISDYI